MIDTRGSILNHQWRELSVICRRVYLR